MPLLIISNGHSLINNDYNFDFINLSQNGVQSYAQIGSMAVEEIINKYGRIIDLFHSLKNTEYSFLSSNTPILMNSAS